MFMSESVTFQFEIARILAMVMKRKSLQNWLWLGPTFWKMELNANNQLFKGCSDLPNWLHNLTCQSLIDLWSARSKEAKISATHCHLSSSFHIVTTTQTPSRLLGKDIFNISRKDSMFKINEFDLMAIFDGRKDREEIIPERINQDGVDRFTDTSSLWQFGSFKFAHRQFTT